MKVKLLLSFFLVCIFSLTVFAQGVRLQFITVNQYGNNLYLDNVTLGNQFNNDVGVGSINNINPGTSYAIGSAPFIVAPDVTVLNVGKNNVTSSFNVTMTVTPGGYSSTKPVASLLSGQSTNLIFDNLTITPGVAIEITITTSLTGDENSSNNTLVQNTSYLPGVQRKILLEEWTSSTCGPCASNNPTIDAFVAARFGSLVPIKYHMNWPSPGNDPMYLYNPTQATDRRNYYGVNAVPHVIMDGIVNPSYPYTVATSLPGAYDPRYLVGSPLSVNVTDTRVGDSIHAVVEVNIVSPLPTGNYYLRVHAIERHIHYATAPGTNGEADFYDVFRKAYPSSLGTSLPTAAGNYIFNFTYPLDMAVWVDSMIYTAAFVQNDETKEVLNSGKGRNVTDQQIFANVLNTIIEKPVISDDFIYGTDSIIRTNETDALVGTYHYNLFESAFPPAGWTLKNPDGGITFAQFTGANGPTLGGNRSVKMDFYSYSTTGQTDTLTSPDYFGLDVTDSVKFNYAYAQYSSSYNDRLVVRVSKDGGLTYPYVIFDKSGAQLATAPATTSSFTPSASQWATFSYSLESIVPVELTSFTATAKDNTVQLNWTTATETNNNGFEIQKKIGDDFVTISFVKGYGTTTTEQSYSFTEKNLTPGIHIYRLKQIDFSGQYQYSNTVEAGITVREFSLDQNYPNPFNPSTKISFSLADDSKVVLSVYNILGQQVEVLLNGNLPAGQHKISFNSTLLNSGIYFYKLEATAKDGKTFVDTKKMTLIK